MERWLSADPMALAVAVGVGVLVGLERERRKGEGPERSAAGLRTFMVAALAGAVAQIVSPVAAAVVLMGVAMLAALSYWRSRSHDPGLTTELALMATTLIGMLAVPQPGLAAACGVVLAAVLAAREGLHHFATDWLSQQELHDGLLLAALALVLLPLLPAQPLSWMGALSPRRVLMLVIVILLMQAAGHLARRLLGMRAGLAVSGLLGGFVSSTATISAMGGMVKAGQASWRAGLCAAILSTAATWLQILPMALVASPHAVRLVWPLSALGAATPLLMGLLLWRQGGPGEAAAAPSRPQRMLRPREALLIGALLVGGAVLVNAAQAQGVQGLLMGTALAALADAHAPMASLLALFDAGRVAPSALLAGLLVAISVNAASRAVVAVLAGGRSFGSGVALALALNLAVVWVWLGLFAA